MRKNPYLDSEDFDECIDWNPNSNFEEDNFHAVDYNQLHSDAMEGQKKRPSHKNKYINKITQIKPESTSNTKKKCMVDHQLSLEPEELKKFKNREAAKESRQRKKIYINLMEEQIKKIEQELQQTNKDIESCKIQIQKSTFNNNQAIGSFDSKLTHAFKKIQRLLVSQESEERNNELNLAIDSIIYRFGATGRERKNNINESYKLILLLAFPVVHRYMAWAAKEKTHLFLTKQSFNLDYEAWFSEMRSSIADRIQANQPFLDNSRTNIANNLEKMEALLVQLKNGKRQVQQFCNILDSLFTEIREILTPAQSAKLVLLIQKYKYREQLHFLQMVNTNSSKNIGERSKRIQEPRKYVKMQGSLSQFQ